MYVNGHLIVPWQYRTLELQGALISINSWRVKGTDRRLLHCRHRLPPNRKKSTQLTHVPPPSPQKNESDVNSFLYHLNILHIIVHQYLDLSCTI